MNTRDLQYLVALADLGHFGKAAEMCFVSQPALSMQIKKLEETLGVKLVERTNKSVVLTDIGIIIAERARNILTQVDELRDIAKAAKDPFSGEIKIGIFPTLAPYLFPHIIPPLSKLFPKLTIYLIEEKTDLLLEKLKQEKLVLDWRKKQEARAAVKVMINEVFDHLPEKYTKPVYSQKCELVYEHVYDAYSGPEKSVYAS